MLRAPLMTDSGMILILSLIMLYDARKAIAQATTDPVEVTSLNTILARWGVQAPDSTWNISGEPCSGWAIDDSKDLDNDQEFNPGIKCNCNYNSSKTCHIIKLRVYALEVVGTIPNELQNLKHLNYFKVDQNYLTGLVPSFIGNLTELTVLSFGINALSGPIPKELGNLKKLSILGMGTNNFNGSIPEEFGNMSSLTQWYMDSSGLSGELPETLSKLTNMQLLWANDNAFTGKIPDYIGTSWISMTELRFQGNSFEGPIPANLANLVNLTVLRIGDITNALGVFFFLPRRFLGNNSLTGSLPSEKSVSILDIDLSYNQLWGSLPSWVNKNNIDNFLRLNLVANNFVDSTDNSDLPSGLKCLQRDTPCYKDNPRYSSFAIRCGGAASFIAHNGIVYQPDNVNLSAASYYVADARRWGVSNVGAFAGASAINYKIGTLSQIQNTFDSELFQSSRMSASSLRYYGIGLENGNYTVKLQFAEIAYPDPSPPKWESLGRRIFDIYIQGALKEKDFNIRKEASNKSFAAVVKSYTIPVTNNFLEIHLFWAGKGTCCVPTQGYYGPAISAISASADFIPTVSNKEPSTSTSMSKSKSKTGLIVGIVVPVVVAGLLVVLAVLVWRYIIKKTEMDEELLGIVDRPDLFSYSELNTATESFSASNILGEGGFGPVYKGILPDNRMVAVKQLATTSHQGKEQFVTEISTISAVQHKNLVKLYGCCIEGRKPLLVYEYLENRSLDQAIFGKSTLFLDWPMRFEICLGVAKGLAYLHEDSAVRIIHRDIKASNILLDGDLNPKISDFGLAKLYDDKKSHLSTRVAGTIGYLAPEYAMRGHLTEKTDVFAFGVLALEVVAGRPNADSTLEPNQFYLLDWAWNLYEQKRAIELVDPRITSFNEEQVTRVIVVSLLCTQAPLLQRPSMSRVVSILAGNIEITEIASRPSYLTEWQFKDLASHNFSTTTHSYSSEMLKDSIIQDGR